MYQASRRQPAAPLNNRLNNRNCAVLLTGVGEGARRPVVAVALRAGQHLQR